MLRNKRFNIFIIPDPRASFKKVTISRKSLISIFVLTLFFTGFLGFLVFHYARTLYYADSYSELLDQNRKLREESIRLKNSLSRAKTQMLYYEDKITKLANIVGVEELTPPAEGGGIGGFDATVGEYESPTSNLIKKELSALENYSADINGKLNRLENIYKDKFEILGFTPSIWPVKGIITHGFGWRKDPFTGKPDYHQALDISARRGSGIFAPADGTVVEHRTLRGYGKCLTLSHGFGLTTRYAHLDGFNVKLGQKVKRGDIVAFVGSSGRSTGPHLHYEIRLNGKAVNPMKYIIEDRLKY